MRRDDERHGTYAGAVLHRKEGKRCCKACLAASAAYMREWRDNSPDARERQYARNRAYRRALTALGQMYPEDYRRLYEAELGEAS